MVHMQMEALEEYGIPSTVIEIWRKAVGDHLLPIQEEAITTYSLFGGGNLLVSAPTSSGKTFVGELGAFHEAYKGGRVIYLVPLRAVAEEKYNEFRERYKEYGIRVIISTGDHREYDDDLLAGNFDLAVVVFEKLLNLSVAKPAVLDSLTLIVVDECQMISADTRGARLEILLTKIRRVANRPRIIGLSAVAENTGAFDTWLRCKLLAHTERPVELREGVVSNDFIFAYREWNTGARRSEKLCDCTKKEDLTLTSLCAHLLQRGDQILVFTDTPDATFARLEELIGSGVAAPAATEALAGLGSLEATDIRERLSESLLHGMAMHNGDMLLEERLLVERHFRDGHIRLVCATSTLAMGVNLPATDVIVEPPTHPRRTSAGWSNVPITVAEFKNMGGRAGRLRYGEAYGRAILMAPSPFLRDRYEGQYIKGTVERLVSRLGESELDDLLLNLIASGVSSGVTDLASFLRETFWWYTLKPGQASRQALESRIPKQVERLAQAGLVEQAEEKLVVTRLGSVCAAKGISVSDFRLIVNWISQEATDASIADEDALIAVALTDAVFQSRFPLSGAEASQWQAALEQFIKEKGVSQGVMSLWRQAIDPYRRGRTAKVALSAHEWISGKSTRDIEREFRVRGGVLRGVARTASWVLDAAKDAAPLLGASDDFANGLDALSQRLLYGVPPECISLAELPVPGLNRGILMQMSERGLTDLDTVLEATDQSLPMSSELARSLKASIIENYARLQHRVMYQQIERLKAIGWDATLVRSLYDAEGADLENRVRDIFKSGLVRWQYIPITNQRHGEPDGYLSIPGEGNLVVSITASGGNIRLTKPREILGASARYSPLFGCLVIGRPDFVQEAINEAPAISREVKPYSLMTVSALAELYVLWREARATTEQVESILLGGGTYLNVERIASLNDGGA